MKTIAILLVVLIMVASGVFLAIYAGADDAPGGVLMGMVVVVGAIGFGVMALRRKADSRRS